MGHHLFEKAAHVNTNSFNYKLWTTVGNTRLHDRVGLIGAAFKADPPTSDTRNSPLSELRRVFDIDPYYYDPAVEGTLPEYVDVWKNMDVVVVGTELAKKHNLPPLIELMKPTGLVVDFWNTWPNLKSPQYKVFGRP